jgi:hypothetical protein
VIIFGLVLTKKKTTKLKKKIPEIEPKPAQTTSFGSVFDAQN